MPDALTTVFIILHIIWWPLSKLFNGIILVLSPFYAVGSFILLPFVHLAQTVIRVLLVPFGLKWAERVETLYIYLGTAGLIGCLTGVIMYIIFNFLSSTLNIDKMVVSRPWEKGRTTAEYRAARREKKGDLGPSPAPTPIVLKKVTGSRRRGLLSQAIMEEEDSDF